jgi:hypothetical protein
MVINAKFIADMLNRAFKADPNAIHTLFCNRVPINFELTNDPYIIVDPSYVIDDQFCLSILGVINGMLYEAGSTELVHMIFENNKLLGFGVQQGSFE